MIYQPPRDLWSKIARKGVALHRVRPLDATLDRAIVTFSFDDAPRSAATAGASILESFDARGVFYISGGLVGGEDHCGPACLRTDIQNLDARGHEIGCHTCSHFDCARTGLLEVEADLKRNKKFLQDLGLSQPLETFAYPYGETTLALKRTLAQRFRSARGITPGLNAQGADLAQLHANALFGADASHAKHLITLAARKRAWLIFFTHDVAETPSAYGCTPAMLRTAVQFALQAGAQICTIRTALARIDCGRHACAQ
jgi:peptidoglycan/xylan/chitin deacetylase (PgdA/CDA1 family)